MDLISLVIGAVGGAVATVSSKVVYNFVTKQKASVVAKAETVVTEVKSKL